MKLTKEKLYQLIKESLDNDTKVAADRFVKVFTKNLFEDSDDFIKKVDIYKNYDDAKGELFYSLYLPDENDREEIACTIGFDLLHEDDNCRPEIKDIEGTAILSSAARSEKFRGMGLGKILSLIALADLSKWKYSVTTDRNTSNDAGSSLVKSINMLPINKSKPFDYIGWLKQKIGASLDYLKSEKTLFKMYSKQIVNVEKLYNHLQPLTPDDPNDDCSPSVNLLVDKNNKFTHFASSAYLPKFAPVVEKLLTMSNKEIGELMLLDKNVIAYTFDLNNQSFKEPLQYLLQNTVYQYNHPDDANLKQRELNAANDLFGDVYNRKNVPKIQMFDDDIIKESKEPISPDHMEKIKMLLNSSIENALLAMGLMKTLGMSEGEVYNMISNMLPQVTDAPLREFYKQQINMYLAKLGGLYDL